jgi:aldehyde dehydrogenase (NAD+)
MTCSALHTTPLPTVAAKPQRKAIAKGQLLIGGKWRDAASGETIDNLDPTTEGVTTTVAKASVAETTAAVDAAYEAFEDVPWSRMHHEERAKSCSGWRI